MKLKFLKIVCLAAVFSISACGGIANAGLIFSVYQQGDDVIVEGSGSLDTTNFPAYYLEAIDEGFLGWSSIAVGNRNFGEYYKIGISGDGPFITRGYAGHGYRHTGAFFGVALTGLVILPKYYTPGAYLESTSLHSNRTLAGFGLTNGTYNYEIDGGEFVRVAVGPPTQLPVPPTFAILALGLIGLASRRFKKQS